VESGSGISAIIPVMEAIFTPDETNLDFLRFSTSKSYPAFSYCSINQNPGNGNVNNGDPYGAVNGYLDWDDNSISDQNCSYSINCFIKDFYVGGVSKQVMILALGMYQ